MAETRHADQKLNFWQSLAQWAEALDETPEERLSRQILFLNKRVDALEEAIAAQQADARQ